MTTKQFYQVALTSPLWLPIIASPLIWMSETMAPLAFILLGSLFLGGLPYLLFIVVAFYLFRYETGASLHTASRIFPVLFALWFSLVLMVLFSWSGETYSTNTLLIGPMLLIFSVIFGYAYVLLTETLYWLLLRLGFINTSLISEEPVITLNL